MKIPFISDWIERLNLREEARKSAVEAALERTLSKAKKDLEEDRAEMFSRPCAVNSGSRCFAECVHFSKGHASKEEFLGEYYVSTAAPRCKLWKS